MSNETQIAGVAPVASAGVHKEDLDAKWAEDFDNLTALQKIAIAEGHKPGERPLTQQEREAGAPPQLAGEQGMSALQRIAQLEGVEPGKAKPDPKPEVVEPEPEPETEVEEGTKKASKGAGKHKE